MCSYMKWCVQFVIFSSAPAQLHQSECKQRSILQFYIVHLLQSCFNSDEPIVSTVHYYFLCQIKMILPQPISELPKTCFNTSN